MSAVEKFLGENALTQVFAELHQRKMHNASAYTAGDRLDRLNAELKALFTPVLRNTVDPIVVEDLSDAAGADYAAYTRAQFTVSPTATVAAVTAAAANPMINGIYADGVHVNVHPDAEFTVALPTAAHAVHGHVVTVTPDFQGTLAQALAGVTVTAVNPRQRVTTDDVYELVTSSGNLADALAAAKELFENHDLTGVRYEGASINGGVLLAGCPANLSLDAYETLLRSAFATSAAAGAFPLAASTWSTAAPLTTTVTYAVATNGNASYRDVTTTVTNAITGEVLSTDTQVNQRWLTDHAVGSSETTTKLTDATVPRGQSPTAYAAALSANANFATAATAYLSLEELQPGQLGVGVFDHTGEHHGWEFGQLDLAHPTPRWSNETGALGITAWVNNPGDGEYRLAVLYPDTYRTMTAVPADLATRVDLANLVDASDMFAGCHRLRTVTLDLPKAVAVDRMFADCRSLETVTLNAPRVGSAYAMFIGCTSLRAFPAGLSLDRCADLRLMLACTQSLPLHLPIRLPLHRANRYGCGGHLGNLLLGSTVRSFDALVVDAGLIYPIAPPTVGAYNATLAPMDVRLTNLPANANFLTAADDDARRLAAARLIRAALKTRYPVGDHVYPALKITYTRTVHATGTATGTYHYWNDTTKNYWLVTTPKATVDADLAALTTALSGATVTWMPTNETETTSYRTPSSFTDAVTVEILEPNTEGRYSYSLLARLDDLNGQALADLATAVAAASDGDLAFTATQTTFTVTSNVTAAVDVSGTTHQVTARIADAITAYHHLRDHWIPELELSVDSLERTIHRVDFDEVTYSDDFGAYPLTDDEEDEDV